MSFFSTCRLLPADAVGADRPAAATEEKVIGVRRRSKPPAADGDRDRRVDATNQLLDHLMDTAS